MTNIQTFFGSKTKDDEAILIKPPKNIPFNYITILVINYAPFAHCLWEVGWLSSIYEEHIITC